MKYAILTLILLSLGCAVRPPIAGRADPYQHHQVNFADPDLANRTAVAPPMTERRNGLLYVTVPVRSSVNRDLHVDYRVLAFTCLVALVTSVVFGLLPALQASRLDLRASLQEGGRGAGSVVREGTRGWLVATEVDHARAFR